MERDSQIFIRRSTHRAFHSSMNFGADEDERKTEMREDGCFKSIMAHGWMKTGLGNGWMDEYENS